jgi:hypothetical protein
VLRGFLQGLTSMTTNLIQHLPSVHTPIPSTYIPTSRFFSSGGPRFGFNLGSGAPSTSANPMTNIMSLGACTLFGWSMPSGFEVFPSQPGGRDTYVGFPFPWVSTPFPGGTFLRGNWIFPFVHTSGPGGFFPETSTRNPFLGGFISSPGIFFGGGSSHTPSSATIPRGTHSPTIT